MAHFAFEDLRFLHLGPLGLDVERGTTVSLDGPSGSGKTRLLRCLADLDPFEGRVRLGGRAHDSFDAPRWRARVAMLPSESAWWADVVGAHFRGGEPGVLAALGFEPDVLGWSVARLSSGERQRLALARLLENEPEVLLLDEPTANLDGRAAERVEGLVEERRAAGACVLWVSHDPAQRARVAQRHVHLAPGGLVEDGTP